MIEENYLYDVAFSFTTADENVANELYKLLKSRVKCFIYSEEQPKLAGGDGEALLNSVYSKETRLVVVIYSDQYGKTKWTRIEETAIRNRGYEEGYGFLVFIPSNSPVELPTWVPKNKFSIGLEKWGLESAAGAIEARIQEYGGIPKAETIADIVAKADTEFREKQKREQILRSENGLIIALQELQEIEGRVSTLVEEIKQKVPEWVIRVKPNNQTCIDIVSYGYSLMFKWFSSYRDSLTGASLYVGLHEGYYNVEGQPTDPFNENKKISEARYKFDIDVFNQNGWSVEKTGGKFSTTSQLVDHWFRKLVVIATKALKNLH